MQRTNLIEQEGYDAKIAAVARIMDVPLDFRQSAPPASCQMCVAALGWLARLGLWRGILRQRINVCRGDPTSTNDEFIVVLMFSLTGLALSLFLAAKAHAPGAGYLLAVVLGSS